MVAYLDSSVALRAILAGDIAIDQAWQAGRVFSSELLQIECRRSIQRDINIGLLDGDRLVAAYDKLAEIEEGTELLELDASIKRRAMEAFPVHVKTLDALHLATALAVARAYPDELVTVFSYDQGLNRAAKLLGLAAPFYSTADKL